MAFSKGGCVVLRNMLRKTWDHMAFLPFAVKSFKTKTPYYLNNTALQLPLIDGFTSHKIALALNVYLLTACERIWSRGMGLQIIKLTAVMGCMAAKWELFWTATKKRYWAIEYY